MRFSVAMLTSLAGAAIATPAIATRGEDNRADIAVWSATNFNVSQIDATWAYIFPYGFYNVSFSLTGNAMNPKGSEFYTECSGSYDSAARELKAVWHSCTDTGVQFRTYYTTHTDARGGVAPNTTVVEIKRKFTGVEDGAVWTVHGNGKFPVVEGDIVGSFLPAFSVNITSFDGII